MDRGQAEEIIKSYGTTTLPYEGAVDYRFRFIDFVYTEYFDASPN